MEPLKNHQKAYSQKKQNAGFTLVELILTLTILAIVTGLAIPAFTAVVTRNKVTGETNRFVTAINYARSEAVKRNSPVAMRSVTEFNWHDGWTLYEGDLTGSMAAPGDDQIIRIFGESESGITLEGNTQAGTWLSFHSNGMLNEASSAVMLVCHLNDPTTGRVITIDRGGRPISSEIADGDDCAH